MFIPFDEVKERVSIEEAARFLQLPVKQHGTQLRSACPGCKSDSERAIVITPAKSAFFCFSSRRGGDQIALVSHCLGIGMKEAAGKLWEQYGTGNSTSQRKGTVPGPEERTEEGHVRGDQPFQPLDYLQATHEAVQSLGLSPDTLEHFGAGYAPRGILRGHLAIPIHDLNGQLVGYVGRTVKEPPGLVFPKNLKPEQYVFNLHAQDGEIVTTNDPLDVLLAYEHGVENMVSFLHRPLNVVALKKRA